MNRKSTIVLALKANNILHKEMFKLQSLLTLLGKTISYIDYDSEGKRICLFPLVLAAINVERQGIEEAIEYYRNLIQTRIAFLLDGRTFGEISKENSKLILHQNTISKCPINFISTHELNNGYIELNELKGTLFPNGSFKGVTEKVYLNLNTGEVGDIQPFLN